METAPHERKTGITLGRKIPTIWVDATTGQGVKSDGMRVTPKVGERRKNPNLTDMLDTAASYGAERIMYTGKPPEPAPGVRHWLLVQTPGWKADGHHLASPPVGRFVHRNTGQKVHIYFASSWFGDLALTPAQAREAWDVTESVIQTIVEKQHLLKTPSGTGLSMWWLSLPRDRKTNEIAAPPHVSPDIADDLRRTSGQHHIEHLVAGPNFSTHEDCIPLVDPEKTRKIDTFTYVDGRFMYAALGRELGVGPGVRLNRAHAFDLMTEEPYARAWYEVRFTVPQDWHHVGLLGVQHEAKADGWFYPNRPGARHVTWADASEINVALANGWGIEPLQAIAFKKARPLDTFMQRLNRARETVEANEELPRPLRRAVTGALRMILLQTIGALAPRETKKTMFAESALEIPPQYQSTVVRHGAHYAYQVPGDRNNPANYHPELPVQVWGRARARVLDAPTATDLHGGGALRVPADSLIGINGDAIYTTTIPTWSLPVERGGGDDGKTGRLRIKGVALGSFNTPATRQARDGLRARAEKAGPAGAWTPKEGA